MFSFPEALKTTVMCQRKKKHPGSQLLRTVTEDLPTMTTQLLLEIQKLVGAYSY